MSVVGKCARMRVGAGADADLLKAIERCAQIHRVVPDQVIQGRAVQYLPTRLVGLAG